MTWKMVSAWDRKTAVLLSVSIALERLTAIRIQVTIQMAFMHTTATVT